MNSLMKLGGAFAVVTSLGMLSGCSKDPTQATTMEYTAKVASILDASQLQISREQKLLSYIGYLTTLQQLGEGSDLDELFDGSITLGDEEPLTIYALLDILNGNNSFQYIAPPKTINYDRNWALDSSFNIGYESEKDASTGRTKFRLSEMTGTEHLVPHWLGDTRLKFNYDSTGVIESIDFQRPNIHVDETMKIQRNGKGLVVGLDIGNASKVNNSISIEYHEGSHLPYSLQQTKYGVLEDKTLFVHDENDNLSGIVYAPAISAKVVKNIVRGLKSAKGAVQVTKMAMMDALRRISGLDIVSIQSNNTVPISTNSTLDASYWAYRNHSWSQFRWNGTKLESMYLQHENLPIDDKKEITFGY